MALALSTDLKRPWEQSQIAVIRNFEFTQVAFNQLLSLYNAFQTTQGVVLVDDIAATAFDAQTGTVFRLAALGNRIISNPRNATNGMRKTIEHYAAGGANRTLTLSGGTGGFRFGSTITGLTATVAGKTDYIDILYNEPDLMWDVVGYVKGY